MVLPTLDTTHDLVLDYTNWRGERRLRRVLPLRIEWEGATQWHPEPGWALIATCRAVDAERSFRMTSVHAILPAVSSCVD